MRIALVAHSGSPLSPETGQEPFSQTASVASHARALAKLGHRVTIYARRDSRGLPGSAILAPRVTVEHVAAGPLAPLAVGELSATVAGFGDYLAQRWHRSPPDLAHAYYWTSGLAALAAARDLDIPLVQTFGTLGVSQQRHGATGDSLDARIRLEACIARSAAAVVASTSEEASDLSRMGMPRASITVVPWGVDTDVFTPDGPVAKRTRRPRLVALAPLGKYQGLDTLVRVLARVPDTELVIGGGPGWPARAQLNRDPVCQDLADLAKRCGVERRLAVTGKVQPGDLPALLRSADLMVSAARYDPFGTTALASMACGTPVAGGAVGGLRDAVLDGTTGVLVPADRPDLLARKLRLLLATPVRLEAFGIAAADRARARYSWERVSRETLAVYQRCQRSVPATPAQAQAAPADTEVAHATTG
jgi:D-inositol-3-phosphate glycosyltransferase